MTAGQLLGRTGGWSIITVVLAVCLCGGGVWAQPINLLTNASFEQNDAGDGPGDLIGWTLTEGNGGDGIASLSSSYSGASDGTKSLRLNSGQRQPDAVLEQNFGTILDHTYDVSFDIGKVATGGGTARVNVEVLGQGGSTLLSGSAGDSDGSGGASINVQPEEFVSFSDVFVGDGSPVTLRITDTSTNGGHSFDALLDNFVVTPEPGCSVLFGLGLLVLTMAPRAKRP